LGEWREGIAASRGSVWTEADYEVAPAERGRSVYISVMKPAEAALVGIDDLRFVTVAPACPCPGDANGSLMVDFADITAVLSQWGASYPGPPGTTGPGDADCDGSVNFADITRVLGSWGASCE
jgi:hypothetical protein